MNGDRIFLSLGALALAGAIGWRVLHPVPLAHVALGIDPSASVERNCGDFGSAAKSFLETADGIREGSTLTVLVMGTDARNPNPKSVISALVPVRSDSVFGVDKKKQAEAEAAFYEQIEQACEAAKGGSGSPIYELIQQGIAHLSSSTLNCAPQGRCYYLIKTDLVDDVRPALRKVLQRAATSPDIAVPPDLARSIRNTGIAVTFCGLSEVTAQRRPGASLESRERIWKELFTNPELVSFQPFCK